MAFASPAAADVPANAAFAENRSDASKVIEPTSPTAPTSPTFGPRDGVIDQADGPTLAPGECRARLVAEANASIRAEGEPWSIAPDLHCAIGARLVLGVTHSYRAQSEVDSGGGLCLTGDDGGCARPYDHAALDALYRLSGKRGHAAVALRVRLVAKSFAPFKPSARVGGWILWPMGRYLALEADPQLAVALTNEQLGNRDFIALPIALHLGGSHIAVHLRTGVRGELHQFTESAVIPIGLGVSVALGSRWSLGIEAGFPKVLGPRNTFKERHAALWIQRRIGDGPPPPDSSSLIRPR